MAAKPNIPVSRKEMYLDVATGGSTELPSPVTREEKYLAKIAGESVGIPTPVTRYEMLLAAVAGESYTLTPVTRLEVYLAKAAGQDVEVPQPITREEMYWFDYVNGQPTPSEQEYTGAVPVTFIADGTPLLDYLISGNEEHSGTPTPDSPIMPQGCGERTGNLFLSNWEQGGIDSSGADIPSANGVRTKNYIPVTPNTIYSISRNITTNYINLRFYNSNKQYINYGTSSNIRIISGNSETNPMAAGMGFCCFEIIDTNIKYMRLNDNSNDTSTKYMMAEGQYTASTMPDYEPYGYKIPISSANTTTPVYLGEVETTRKIKKLVLTGEESWNTSKGTYYITVSDYYRMYDIGSHLSVCSHYPDIQLITLPEMHYCLGGLVDGSTHTAWNGNIVFNPSPMISSLTDWKAFLAQQYAAGTPVCVWYVLATEETGIVNEPLMKIGSYADSISMEQTGIEIPTINGSNTFDVDTTVKPSEVYIKYKGYPVVGSQTSLQSSAYAPAEVSSQSESIDDINSSLLGKDEET